MDKKSMRREHYITSLFVVFRRPSVCPFVSQSVTLVHPNSIVLIFLKIITTKLAGGKEAPLFYKGIISKF